MASITFSNKLFSAIKRDYAYHVNANFLKYGEYSETKTIRELQQLYIQIRAKNLHHPPLRKDGADAEVNQLNNQG